MNILDTAENSLTNEVDTFEIHFTTDKQNWMGIQLGIVGKYS